MFWILFTSINCVSGDSGNFAIRFVIIRVMETTKLETAMWIGNFDSLLRAKQQGIFHTTVTAIQNNITNMYTNCSTYTQNMCYLLFDIYLILYVDRVWSSKFIIIIRTYFFLFKKKFFIKWTFYIVVLKRRYWSGLFFNCPRSKYS